MHVGYATGFQHQSGPERNDTQFLKRDLDLAIQSEALGFESIWVTEHHFSDYSISPSPLQSLAYLAGKTKRVKLGTQVVVLPWNDPVRVAEQALWLDNITEGRLLLGLGRGLGKMEYEGMRVDINQTRQLYREYSELIIQALETGVIEGGEITKQPRRELRPRPYRSFEGRIFGSAGSPESVRTVAELGIGVLIINPEPRPNLGVDFETYNNVWAQTHGESRMPPAPLLSGTIFVDESSERAKELSSQYHRVNFRAAVKNYGMADDDYGTTKGNEFYKSMRIAPDKIDEMADKMGTVMPAGNPTEILEILDNINKQCKLQGFFPHFHFGGMPHEEAERNMRLFAEKCLPEVKSWPCQNSLDGQPLAELAA
ncbi:LLM class flavin-dependent oxidoreductase [Caulobacter sp. UNC279MFTsu5.1]|uniref:LLM class flavin-dependent oxidoreductase n=1 Tax=Caulobacter sp. UNC279MFTsu5.1 TaxID=1502775 RepID=UPI0003686DD1|nr:LLM class flavin-dependent oxidoreductase [Caulobacter sp. UNC279MFTsu5.1]SFJ32046.1 Flavin-dependent oxidoreductase, luciferase family (includes alkanesulfonate monooxygenase SsuD and methylene tetrahydromethanopterin reductase) [Caulobacter sp. UNC279MFTsu5.1]